MEETATSQALSDEQLVIAARTSEPTAYGSLVRRWFDPAWEVAWRILHERDVAADVVQDTFLRAWQHVGELQRPAAFGTWVLRMTRDQSLKHLGWERREGHEPEGGHGIPAGAQQGGEQDLTCSAVTAALGERDASLLDLHLRHEIEPRDLHAELHVARHGSNRAMAHLRDRVGPALRAWRLWRDGDPACDGLRADLAGADLFLAARVQEITKHTTSCAVCAEESGRISDPATMLAAVPLEPAPAELRDRAIMTLATAGAPAAASSPRPSGPVARSQFLVGGDR